MAPATLALALVSALLCLRLDLSAAGTGPLLQGALVLIAGMALAFAAGHWRNGVPLLLAAWCLYSAAGVLADRLSDEQHGTDAVLTGTVCEFPRLKGSVARFMLDVDGAQGIDRAPPRVLVSWYGTKEPPAIGERWRLSVRLRLPRGLANPGGFDFEQWLFSRRIAATGWVRSSAANGRLTTVGACLSARWRGQIAARIRAILGERPALPYVLGLSVGDYQALPEAEWEQLRRTGTIHLISISGFHVALVAVPFALGGALLGCALLRFGVPATPRVLGAMIAAAAGVGYGALAGFSVPTVRAVLMLLVICGLTARRHSPGPATVLSLALLGVLGVEPFAPLAPGFWLSFAGVAILVASGSLLAPMPGMRIPRATGPVLAIARVAGAFVFVQFAMTVALAPLLVHFFAQAPAAGAIANFVAIPVFSLAIVPLSLLGAVLTLVLPSAAAPVLETAAMVVDAWRIVLAWCADVPFAIWQAPAIEPAAFVAACAGVIWLLWPRPAPGRGIAVLLLSSLGAVAPHGLGDGDLRLTVLDVGQGLAVIVETANHSMVYDAGPSFGDSDTGERVVVPALRALGRRRLDMLIVSHPDNDHAGGAPSVIRQHPEVQSLGNKAGQMPFRPDDSCVAGRRWSWDGVEFEILHPPAGRFAGSSNDTSCVLLVRSAGGAVLLPGDIEAGVEHALAAAGRLPRVDIVVAPHHGSRTSSSAALVRATRPRYIVFPAGYANRWRFPATEVVERWTSAGACALVTGDEGAIRFAGGRRWPLRPIELFRRDLPRLWRLQPASARPCD